MDTEKSRLTRRSFLAAGAALATGCWGDGQKYHYVPTPDGYLLAFQNIGSVPNWYSMETVLVLFDAAVDLAKQHLGRYGVTPEQVEGAAKSCKHVGIDHPRFATNASETGWASGAFHADYRLITLAFWTRAKGDIVPPDAPPWTVYSWGSLRPSPAWDWGVHPNPFPALGHELGHYFFGGQFEHGWTPPIVNSVMAERYKPDELVGCGYITGT